MHRLVPVTFLYLPPTHAVQGPPFGPVYPVLQVQLVSSVLLISAVFESDGHVVHACEPSQFLYFPCAHSAHGPPSGPVNPLMQEQIRLEATEDWFCVHEVQACVPLVPLNLPTSHMAHGCSYVSWLDINKRCASIALT